MSLSHWLLARAYHPLRAVQRMRQLVGRPRSSLRVLLYHDIAPHEQDRFANQLRWLARSWTFVNADRFAAMVLGDEPIRGQNLLLTFDDGFASNRVVAEAVLKPMRIPAVFFVISELVALQDRDEARDFIAQHVQPGGVAADLPSHLTNMGWSDLEALLELGHVVGGHTRDHSRLSGIRTDAELVDAIASSADVLEQRLRTSIRHFAFPFGNVDSVSPQALRIAGNRFSFVHSGLRGDNAPGVSAAAIRRDSATPADSLALLGAYLNGAADFRYARSRAKIDQWSRPAGGPRAVR